MEAGRGRYGGGGIGLPADSGRGRGSGYENVTGPESPETPGGISKPPMPSKYRVCSPVPGPSLPMPPVPTGERVSQGPGLIPGGVSLFHGGPGPLGLDYYWSRRAVFS